MSKCQQLLHFNINEQDKWTHFDYLNHKISIYFGYFRIYEQFKFHAQLSWAWNKFYNLRGLVMSEAFIGIFVFILSSTWQSLLASYEPKRLMSELIVYAVARHPFVLPPSLRGLVIFLNDFSKAVRPIFSCINHITSLGMGDEYLCFKLTYRWVL